MSKQNEAVALLRQGLSPSEIAEKLQAPVPTVMRFLFSKVGEGELRRSDIIFSIHPELRHEIDRIVAETKVTRTRGVIKQLEKANIEANQDDVAIYLKYRRGRVILGDMYELLRNIEVRLHRFIKLACIAEFGEENWWRGGVPDRLRADCAAMLERDPEPASEPYCYVYLLGLREILDKGWSALSPYLPRRVASNKKDLLERITRLNRIRNAVMHPVRNDSFTEEDFEFVHTLERDLGELHVQAREKPKANEQEAQGSEGAVSEGSGAKQEKQRTETSGAKQEKQEVVTPAA